MGKSGGMTIISQIELVMVGISGFDTPLNGHEFKFRYVHDVWSAYYKG